MSFVNSNLLLLKKKNNELYQVINELQIDDKAYEVYSTRNGKPTVKVFYQENDISKEIYLHSKYEPVKEAEKFIAANTSDKKIYVIYGFALGYHIKELLNKITPDCEVYVADLDIKLFKLALTLLDLTDVLADDRLQLIISDNEKKLAGELGKVLTDDVKLIMYMPSVKTIPEKFPYFKFVLENWYLQSNVTDKWTDLLMENYNKNKLLDCPNVSSLFGIYRNKPMILVSAGPSLNKNKHLLKDLQRKYLIFAVGSAFKPLLQIGVKPDYVCIIDPKPSIFKQFEGHNDEDVPLIFLDTASARAIAEYQGPKYVASNNINRVADAEQLIDTGGSVATAVLDIGIKMGCNPIVFIGQDLAYTDNEHHADAKMYNKNAEVKIKETPNMRKVRGYNGQLLNTTLGLLSYKYWIENRIKDTPSVKFYNATEGGAGIDGAEHDTLANVIDRINEMINKS